MSRTEQAQLGRGSNGIIARYWAGRSDRMFQQALDGARSRAHELRAAGDAEGADRLELEAARCEVLAEED